MRSFLPLLVTLLIQAFSALALMAVPVLVPVEPGPPRLSTAGIGAYVLFAYLGAVVGSVVGNAAERYGTREEAVELLVQLKSGERRSIVQAKGSETLAAGDAVIIVTTGGKVRVTRAPASTPAVRS